MAESRFVPALEGMRGCAALGVLLTHVAFQTGADTAPFVGRALGRLDLSVAVFFGLSGFLLWRAPASGARLNLGSYLTRRAIRILPAYWAVVVTVLLLLPGAAGGWAVWCANLTLTQVFVPLTLTRGLTQMWSLSVEVAFYLALPLLAAGLRRARTCMLVGMAVASLGWAFVPVPTPGGVHATNWLPGYFSWFAVGMVLAELAHTRPGWFVRLAEHRRALRLVASVAFGLAATDLAGPVGLATQTPVEFMTKIVLGAVLIFGLSTPLVLGGRHRLLGSAIALAIGRWSYGIFLWHVAVLATIFPTFGIVAFHGRFVFVAVLTVLLTVPLAAASYAFVEEPARTRVSGRRSAQVAEPPPIRPDIPPRSATAPSTARRPPPRSRHLR